MVFNPVNISHNLWDNLGAAGWRTRFVVSYPEFPESHVLTPGRYVGAEDVVDDGEPFEEKMGRLTKRLGVQFRESEKLEGEITDNLKKLGYGITG
jgi:hypothetical protein